MNQVKDPVCGMMVDPERAPGTHHIRVSGGVLLFSRMPPGV